MKPSRLLLWLVAGLCALALAVLAAAWLWSGTDRSLADTLGLAARWLPAGQTLQTQDVHGSLRAGGRIGLLRWSGQGLRIELRDLRLGWRWQPLLARRLVLDELSIGALRVDDQRPPGGPAAAPPSLTLPLREIDVPFTVQALQWAGPPAVQATALAGRYHFDGATHQLQIERVDLAAGRYRADARLQAQAPMALQLRVQGEVQAPIPGARAPLALTASATLGGELAGRDAQLALNANLRPAAAAQDGRPMQATVAARINPWAAQPLADARADFDALDLASLWPGAPQTALSGQAEVRPAGHDAAEPSWQASARLENAQPGPWSRHRLPLKQAQVKVEYAQAAWGLRALTAQLAGGELRLAGRLVPGAGWQGQAQLRHIDPAALHERLATAPIDGWLEARSRDGRAIDFEARLASAARRTSADHRHAGPALQNAAAQGRWHDGTLNLTSLQARLADGTQLNARADVQLASRATRGELHLRLPGAQFDAQGQASAAQGDGNLTLAVNDAARLARWLAQWPGVPERLEQTITQGSANLTGRWQGGWGEDGRKLNLQVRLDVPRLDLRQQDVPAGDAPRTLRVRAVHSELQGPLSALVWQLAGQLETGTLRAQWQTAARGAQDATGDWRVRLDTATLQWQDSLRPGAWALRLAPGASARWQSSGPGGQSLQVDAGRATLTGPAEQQAVLDWQPLSWTRQGARQTLRTEGRLRGLPLDWLDALGAAPLNDLGLGGDLLFDGDWSLQATDTLRLQAALVRRSGDLRLRAEDDAPAAGTTARGNGAAAGVREASLRLTGEGDRLRAQLRWDSARAGQAAIELSTRLAREGDAGWRWPADAPLTGTLRAELPRLGVWSALTPPGWRMRGTLGVDATLGGTRRMPQWSGTLRADALALRSVVEGIGFSDGQLRARLDGQRLDIDEFSLRGAGGAADGGRLSAKGFLQWRGDAAADPAGGALSHLRMEIEAKAEALRFATRADRQLTVSGQLQARLDDARLMLRGALRADQALIILPDEATPTLGSDVTVRPPGGATAGAGSTQGSDSGPNSGGMAVRPDVIIALDLGRDFRLEGHGLTTRLAGKLELRAVDSAAPSLHGELRTVDGRYKAYGQQLDIEQGLLRFTGPYDNPSLDVLAIRPNLAQRVGVQITGTVLAPHVRLYSEPPLPESETLAWLVLGRSAANGGAEAAVMQQAALALLSGSGGKSPSSRLTDALGLDELSLRGADSGVAQATIKLGKRFSRSFYVAYEQSVSGTLGTFYIFYDLSRRFTLRAQTGAQSALDLIFTLRYD